MRRFALLIPTVVSFTFLVGGVVAVPESTFAAACTTSADCPSGQVCNPQFVCQSATVGSGGGSGAVPAGGTSLGVNPAPIQGYANAIVGIINGPILQVLIAIAFIVFLWGIYKYFILGANSEMDRATGRTFVIYGIIGFVVIFSIWGLVNAVLATFSLAPGGVAPNPPTL